MANTNKQQYYVIFTNSEEIVDFSNLCNNGIKFTIEKILQDNLEDIILEFSKQRKGLQRPYFFNLSEFFLVEIFSNIIPLKENLHKRVLITNCEYLLAD